VRLGLVFAALLMASFAFLPATAVLAHADLLKAEFQGASSAGGPPRTLVMLFSEAIDPTFSQVQLLDDRGRVIDPGPGTVSATDPRQLSIEIGRLASGDYNADIQVRSVDDGHITQTTLPFSLGMGVNTIGGLPPLGAADPALGPSPALESIARWLGLLGVALAVGLVVLGFLVRRPGRTELLSRSLPLVYLGVGLIVVGAFLLLLIEAGGAAGVPLIRAFGTPLADVLTRRSGELLLARVGLALLLTAVSWAVVRRNVLVTASWHALLAAPGMLLTAGILLTFSLSGHAAASSHAVLSAGLIGSISWRWPPGWAARFP
jgi:methionine-rich copper-binding protein CopC